MAELVVGDRVYTVAIRSVGDGVVLQTVYDHEDVFVDAETVETGLMHIREILLRQQLHGPIPPPMGFQRVRPEELLKVTTWLESVVNPALAEVNEERATALRAGSVDAESFDTPLTQEWRASYLRSRFTHPIRPKFPDREIRECQAQSGDPMCPCGKYRLRWAEADRFGLHQYLGKEDIHG